MKTSTFILGLVLAALGVVALFTPSVLLELARRIATPEGLYLAAAIRIGFAALLLAVAGRSRSPVGLRVLGVLTLIAGLVTPFIGAERAQEAIVWWSSRGALPVRLWSVVAIAFGLFMAWAVTPERRRAPRAAPVG